jgi:hypothetical protein
MRSLADSITPRTFERMLPQQLGRSRTARLAEAMTAGVYVEARDRAGHTIGQTVFTAWQGRPLPQVGETLICPLNTAEHGRRKVAGDVVERRFEIQTDTEGHPEVWVSMVVLVEDNDDAPAMPRGAVGATPRWARS